MDTLLRKKKICIFLLRFNFFPTGLSSFKLLESASNCSGYQKYKRDHKTYPSKSAVEKVYRDCSSRNSKSSKDSNDESPSSSTLSFSSFSSATTVWIEKARTCSLVFKKALEHWCNLNEALIAWVILFHSCFSSSTVASRTSPSSSRRPPRILTNRKFGSRRRHTPSKIDSILM